VRDEGQLHERRSRLAEHELPDESKYHKKRMIRYHVSLDVKQNDVYKIIHEKKWNPHLMKSLDPTVSLQEIWRIE